MRLHRLFAVVIAGLTGGCCATKAVVPRSTLELTPRSLILSVGQEARLTVATNPMRRSGELRWASSAPVAVSVSDSGVVRASQMATAIIRVWVAADPTVRDSATIITTALGPS